MSELHTTLFVMSCLAALGLGLSGGLALLYYTQWKPMILAYQIELDKLTLERNDYKKAAAFWADLHEEETV